MTRSLRPISNSVSVGVDRIRNLKPIVFWPMILIALAAAAYFVLGFRKVDPGVAAPTQYGTRDLSEALGAFVIDVGVDYEGLLANPRKLRRQAAAFGEHGPESTPETFPDDASRLAYYINAYNTFVLLGVMTHWPIGSVHDVHGLIEPEEGFGFFYALRFELDGGTVNLIDLEDDIIRPFGDARVHAAINCASESCPALQRDPFTPDHLDEELDTAMSAMVNDEQHVKVDIDREALVLNPIFEWYDEDFRAHAERLEIGADTLDFIAHYLNGERRARFETARDAGFTVRFRDYDWSLNRAR